MNNKRVKLVILLVVAALVGLVVYLAQNDKKSRIDDPTNRQGVGEVEGAQTAQGETSRFGNVTSAARLGRSEALTNNVKPEIEASVNFMNAPINFEACVVDQDGSPISGALVVLSIRTWQAQALDASATQSKTSLITDASGRFRLSGATGDRLTVEDVSKPGFLLSPNARQTYSFGDSPKPFAPDPNSPVLIRMWKEGEPAQIESREGFFGLVPDGSAHVVDLLENSCRKGQTGVGDLLIRLERPDSVKPRERYRWTVQIKAIDGGLVETADELMYRAPDTGYSLALEIEMDPDKEGWTSVLKKSLYLKSRGGKIHGALHMTIRPNYASQSAIQIQSVLNTNSSRNLQP